jgi:O-antigen/teichoic acid export membrane protein
MVPLCLLAAAIAAPLIHLVYGSKYLPLVIPLQILLMSQAFSCTGAVNSCLLYGTEKQGFIVRWGTLIAILNIVLDLILIPKLGALGAAVANCTAQVAGVFTGNFYAVRYIHVSFPWKSTATVYSAALIAVAPAAYLARRSHSGIALLIGSVVIGAGIYIGLLMAARELGKRDLDMLKGALLAKALPSEPFQAVEPA